MSFGIFHLKSQNENYGLVFTASGRVIKPKLCRSRPTGLWAGYAPGLHKFCRDKNRICIILIY